MNSLNHWFSLVDAQLLFVTAPNMGSEIQYKMKTYLILQAVVRNRYGHYSLYNMPIEVNLFLLVDSGSWVNNLKFIRKWLYVSKMLISHRRRE